MYTWWTADICVWFCAHRLIHWPFCVQDNSATATICSYISLASIPLQSISSTQQKWPKRAGQGRGACHPFATNSWQPPYPCFYLILPVSTTDKLIFESCVLVVCLTWAVTLCSPLVFSMLISLRLARESYLSLQIHIIVLTAKQQHSAYIWLTIGYPNYSWDIHKPTVPISIPHNKASDHAQQNSS